MNVEDLAAKIDLSTLSREQLIELRRIFRAEELDGVREVRRCVFWRDRAAPAAPPAAVEDRPRHPLRFGRSPQ